MNQSLSTLLSRKVTKFGFWFQCTAYLHRQILTLSKNSKSKSNKILSQYTIRSRVIITFKSNSQKEIKIKFNGENTLFLQFKSAEIAQVWEQELKKQSKIKSPDYEQIIFLGRGFFSTVNLVKLNNELIALKTVPKNKIKQYELESNAISERDCMIKCKHPFIVELRFCFQDISTFRYGMEFLPGGDLFSLMKRNKNISLVDKKIYLAEIGLALTHLHSKGFIYRDVKPENVLISNDGHVKVGDFGLSEYIGEEGYAKGIVGTPEYIAPEVLQGLNYDFSCDWWSFGVLAYQFLCNKMSYSEENKNDLYHKIKNSSPKFPYELDKQSQDFLCLFLMKNPQYRATFNSTKKHPFWDGINFDNVLSKRQSLQFIPNSSYSIEEKCRKYFFRNDQEIELQTEDDISKSIYPMVNRFSFGFNKN
jgi:serine/threonine protein kinase